MDDAAPKTERPTPAVEPRTITLDEYHAFAPEKFELWEGYLFDGPAYPDSRRDLLLLLLTNEGLREVVKLAPPERWRDALRDVYGEP